MGDAWWTKGYITFNVQPQSMTLYARLGVWWVRKGRAREVDSHGGDALIFIHGHGQLGESSAEYGDEHWRGWNWTKNLGQKADQTRS